MPRKKKTVTEQLVECTCTFPCGGTEASCPSATGLPRKPPSDGQDVVDTVDTEAWKKADELLDKLSMQVYIPDDKPAGITLRDQAVLHLLSGADLHRITPDAVTHRIKRCIDIANQVVELLGEDNAEV